jgi:division protein CdvB (Snf7/Vps24/ESCRT-III family)
LSRVEKFAKKWERQLKEPAASRIKSAIFPDSPLKRKIDLARTRLKMQVDKLDQVSARMMERDKGLFNKVVDAFAKHDMDRAKLYANELAELRKMSKIILFSKLSLEKVLLRLETIRDVGDLIVAMAPVIGVVRAVKSSLAGILPDAERELGELLDVLGGLVSDMGELTGYSPTMEASEEAQKILEEAMTIAEQRMREKLPEIPAAGVPVSDKEKTSK